MIPRNIVSQAPRENVTAKDQMTDKNKRTNNKRYRKRSLLLKIQAMTRGAAPAKYAPKLLGVLNPAVARVPGSIICPRKISLLVK